MNTKVKFSKNYQRAPFVALMEFKEQFLHEGKHKTWAFRSDQLVPKHSTIEEQYLAIEREVFELQMNRYREVVIFDNRKEASNLVVYKELRDVLRIDEREALRNELNISQGMEAFLKPVPTAKFIDFMIDEMKRQRREYYDYKHITMFGIYSENDFKNNINEYKKMIAHDRTQQRTGFGSL